MLCNEAYIMTDVAGVEQVNKNRMANYLMFGCTFLPFNRGNLGETLAPLAQQF